MSSFNQEIIIQSVPVSNYTFRIISSGMHKNRKYPENNVRSLRESLHLTQDRLADLLDPPTSGDMIAKLERGDRELTLGWLLRLAGALRCRPEDLFSQSVNPANSDLGFDNDLLQTANKAIKEEARTKRRKLSDPELMAYTVLLYLHVMKYRALGKKTEPSAEIAELILQQAV